MPRPDVTRHFFLLAGLLAVTTYIVALQLQPVVKAADLEVPGLETPDTACAGCHREIYERYQQTSMARGSGMAMSGLIPGRFHHQPSDIDYSVFERDGQAWMSYSRPDGNLEGALSGERRLDYFIGSGHRGRTFLYNEDGRWYELPINFYTRRNAWKMAPAFDDSATMPAPLPTDPNCLHCHTTAGQPSLPGARNRYASAPFRQGGIGCSACHGDPASHLASQGRAAILNPPKLAPEQRDSVCLQCHLEGDAVVYRPGRSLAQFVPGNKLSSIAVYFVRSSQQGGGARATSQFEALLRSACKRASGDRLTCTTCHDPHFDPPPAERVAYFRARCLTCHTQPAMASHHPEQRECAKCHMQSLSTADISHEQVTDHDIEARPSQPKPHLSPLDEAAVLVPVGGFSAGDREFGLAYAQLAQRGDRKAAQTALNLLEKLPRSTTPDPEVSVRLGYLQQISGDTAAARASYTAALEANPWEPTALANLAVLDAGTDHLPEAIRLLERLVAADPSQTAPGLNLAFIDCSLHRTEQAKSLLRQLLASNPDNPQLREFLRSGTYGDRKCFVPQTP